MNKIDKTTKEFLIREKSQKYPSKALDSWVQTAHNAARDDAHLANVHQEKESHPKWDIRILLTFKSK